MTFISVNDVVNTAIANEIIDPEERGTLTSFLEMYDLSLDGQFDNGFNSDQVERGLLLTFSHKFSQDTEKANSIHRLIYSTLNKTKIDGDESVFITALKIAVAIIFPAGCAAQSEYHDCIELSCGSCALCYWDENNNGDTEEKCHCPSDECAWHVNSSGEASCEPREYDPYRPSHIPASHYGMPVYE